jgi:hypothetical protein
VAIARRASTWFMAGQVDSLLTLMPRAHERGANSARQMSAQFRSNAGAEASLMGERWVWRNAQRQYWRTMTVTGDAPEPIVLRFVIGSDGMVEGVGLSLLSMVPAIDSAPPKKPS